MKKVNCPRCNSELLIKKEVEKSKLIRCPKCKKEFLNELFYLNMTPKTVAKKTPKKRNKTNQQIPNESSSSIKLKYWIFAIFGLWVMYSIMTNKTTHSKVYNSEYDGSVHQVERYLKETLKDPNSLEVIQWSKVYDMKNSQYGYRYKVRVKYRAKNSFGGYVIESNLFYLDEKGNVTNVE